MISILLTLSPLLITVQSTSILPIDSSSSVQVKSSGQEYAYTIHESKVIPLEHLPLVPIIENPFLKIQPQENLEIKELKQNKESIQGQEKLLLDKLKPEGTESGQILTRNQELPQNEVKLEISGAQKPSEQKLEKHTEQLYIPGYRLVPNLELQLLEHPYYYPYLSNYAYHYPYIRFI